MRRREFVLAGCAGALSGAGGTLDLRAGGHPVTTLHFGSQWDKPFLYPLRTRAGTVVSRGYPLEQRQGESTDHPWHRGIWYGHGVINGADYWREQGKDKAGRMVPKAAPSSQEGGSRVTIDLQLVPPAGRPVGSVRQEYKVRDEGPLRIIDVVIAIAADHGVPLTFGDTDDGGFAFRLADQFHEERGARLRNSEGLEGTKNIWGKPARWVDYAASLNGKLCGAVVFDHPSNFGHPTRWHARGYGLCSANPFAERSFTGQRPTGDSHTLPAGQALRFRYAVIIHEGAFDPPAIEKRHRAFAAG
jgi:hypothetical protein